MGQIIAALQAVGQIISFGREIIKFIDDNKNERWFQDSALVLKDWRNAKTSDERREILKRIARLDGGM